MSVQDQIERLQFDVADSYSAVYEKGGTLPEVSVRNADNLAEAIRSISSGASVEVVPVVLGKDDWDSSNSQEIMLDQACDYDNDRLIQVVPEASYATKYLEHGITAKLLMDTGVYFVQFTALRVPTTNINVNLVITDLTNTGASSPSGGNSSTIESEYEYGEDGNFQWEICKATGFVDLFYTGSVVITSASPSLVIDDYGNLTAWLFGKDNSGFITYEPPDLPFSFSKRIDETLTYKIYRNGDPNCMGVPTVVLRDGPFNDTKLTNWILNGAGFSHDEDSNYEIHFTVHLTGYMGTAELL